MVVHAACVDDSTKLIKPHLQNNAKLNEEVSCPNGLEFL